MRKLWTALLCLALVCAMLGGCTLPLPGRGSQGAMVMTVSGADVGSDLFAYYLTRILRAPTRYGLQQNPGREEVETEAIRLCTEYVAVNTAFQDAGLRLTGAYKKQIAENVSTQWSFYKNYYRDVGVSKQTLTKYETCEARRAQMVTYLYGKDGVQAVPDLEWDAYYAVNYVTFRSINGYLTQTDSNGKMKRLPDDKVAEVENLFREMSAEVRNGTSIEDVCRAHADSPYIFSSEAETVTINRDTSNYPQEFFASVQKMNEDAVHVIETTDYIFLVVKQSAKLDENLQAHRLSCLQKMCKESFDSYLSDRIAGFRVQKDASAVNSVYALVSSHF